MDTPNLKCPRSGRILTPLSMDYWRLRKKLNEIISDSSSSDEENDETPLKKPGDLRKKKLVSVFSPDSTRAPIHEATKENEEPLTTGAKARRSPPGSSKAIARPAGDGDSDDEDIAFRPRPRRRAQKFVIESSTSGSDEQKDAESAGSNRDGSSEDTETISKALFSTRIGTPSPPAPDSKTPAKRIVVEISSDDDDIPGLDARLEGAHKTPPAKSSDTKETSKFPVTEPRKRIVQGLDRKVMPPPSVPLKRTLKAKTKPQVNDDADENFDELLEKLRDRRHDDDDYDESQVDLNNTVNEWETSNADDRAFLDSLDEDQVPLKSCHKDALVYRKSKFTAIRQELAEKLFQLYHRTVFQSRFESEIPISWNIHMTKTAGFCYYRKHSDGSRSSKIELSSKVIDRLPRLRDTLLHEMCHAGAWLIHGYRDGHGTLFKFWTQRALQLLGRVVTTKHYYVIETKYVYKCQGCANEVHRHSKSLDTSRFICSNCKGRFVLFVNDKRKKQITPASERQPSAFSKFVKEEYKVLKTQSPHLKHGEVMSALSERWKTMKNSA